MSNHDFDAFGEGYDMRYVLALLDVVEEARTVDAGIYLGALDRLPNYECRRRRRDATTEEHRCQLTVR